ncbi:CgeB family protein [Desulfovibrio inopinatus]|uniref:CgeB family protein n=1 Tax=Desulfovibrio inopinatus TaxID=102109 RepID=UPI000489C2DB|nr:glycosyltransferase [Desulfovibrio inopinatus]
MPSVRVLVVLPLYGGSLPVGRFVMSALTSLGHTVEAFEAPDFYSAFTALKELRVFPEKYDYLEHEFVQFLSKAILAKVETFEPDLVLSMAQAPLSRQALKRLRRDKVPTAMWFVEDHRVFPYWEVFAPLYDFFFVIQKEPFLSKLAGIGVENAMYLPMAADPNHHRPLELTVQEKRKYGSDISFLGAGYPNRRVAFRELLGFDLKIWGTEWDGDANLAPYVQEEGRRIDPATAVKIYNASKINLNLHSSMQAKTLVTGDDFVNPRTFELAMCGAFQLVDNRQLLSEHFSSDELVTFDSMEGLKAQIDTMLRDEDARHVMAQRARTRALAEHTYAARMQCLLDFVASRLPGWPHRASYDTALSELPEAIRQQVGQLLERHGLRPEVSFTDLVWTLRKQSDPLSEMETAILFLDEWQKQYGRQH